MTSETLAPHRPRAADDAAFDLVYAEHHHHLVQLSKRWVFDGGAEHIAQEVLLAHWQRPERYDARKGTLRAYLRMNCRSRAIDAVRSDVARRRRDAGRIPWGGAAARALRRRCP